jgi:hypothetical protein
LAPTAPETKGATILNSDTGAVVTLEGAPFEDGRRSVTQFEFVLVAISIVMALGVSRRLDVMGPALRSDRRSWIHVGWVVQKFFNHIFWWWSLWLARDTHWNLALYLFAFIGPVVLYLQASAPATPSEDAPMSWQQRFFEIRVLFFVGNLVLVAITLAAGLVFGASFPAALATTVLLLGLFAVVGLATENIQAHGVIVILALLVQAAGFGGALFVTQAAQ